LRTFHSMSPEPPKKRSNNFWTPLLLALVLIIGLVAGFYLNKLSGNKRDFATLLERNDRLEEMIDIITEQYVDSLSQDSLYNDAINGILSHLDPHTSYIPAKDLDAVNAALEGNFAGFGMEYQFVNDTPMVSIIQENSPAYFGGMETGDMILKVNDTLVAGQSMSKAELVARVRKRSGKYVSFNIYRPIEGKHLSIKLEKGEVEVNSIDAAYLLDAEVGYIRIKRFAANTYKEFYQSLSALKEAGMKKLIVDVRGNGGGYLEAATEIADEFISGNKLLVYTYGSKIGRENYNAYKAGIFENGRLMIMVDENSASASEILAGAIQDWDRGVIIGRPTYGKGLVQEQFEMGDGAAMRITVARYYTPVGRSIQKSYEQGREKYFWEKSQQINTVPISDTVGVTFYTSRNNRPVYGGGGIRPDVITSKYEDVYSSVLSKIINDSRLDSFIYGYYARNPRYFKSMGSLKDLDGALDLNQNFARDLDRVCTSISPMYASVVKRNKIEYNLLINYVKATLARIQFNNEGFYHIINRSDKVLKQAYEIINSDQYSHIIGGNLVKPSKAS
jgi:carboxyl-terminal processing protease